MNEEKIIGEVKNIRLTSPVGVLIILGSIGLALYAIYNAYESYNMQKMVSVYIWSALIVLGIIAASSASSLDKIKSYYCYENSVVEESKAEKKVINIKDIDQLSYEICHQYTNGMYTNSSVFFCVSSSVDEIRLLSTQFHQKGKATEMENLEKMKWYISQMLSEKISKSIEEGNVFKWLPKLWISKDGFLFVKDKSESTEIVQKMSGDIREGVFVAEVSTESSIKKIEEKTNETNFWPGYLLFMKQVPQQ